MTMTRIRRVTLGLWVILAWAAADRSADATPAASGKPSEAVRQLQKERVKALKEHLQGLYERVKIGRDPVLNLIDTLRELADAELELADTPAQEVAALEIAVARFRELEKELEVLVPAGLQRAQSVAQFRAARLKVEIELEKRKPAKR